MVGNRDLYKLKIGCIDESIAKDSFVKKFRGISVILYF